MGLSVISLYAVGVLTALLSRARGIGESFDQYIGYALQLCLGSLFSALVVLYFRSAGQLFTFAIVVALFGMMVWNEFSDNDNAQQELLWGIFCVSLIMLRNFALPFVVNSVHPAWFYVSCAVGTAIIWALRWLADASLKSVRTATVAAAVLVGVYLLGWIPPVPLVMENSLVGTNFAKQGGEYTCQVDEPGLLQKAGLADPVVHYRPGDKVAVLSAVSAPDNAEADLEHRWYKWVEGEWKAYDTIGVTMRGGREEGWRFWTNKRNVSPGEWKVETALEGGAVLGYETFVLEKLAEGEEAKKSRQAL